MKKLFSIFCCLLLSASMVTQAQLLDAVNESPEGGDVLNDNGQVSGRNNAPQATTLHFDWRDENRTWQNEGHGKTYIFYGPRKGNQWSGYYQNLYYVKQISITTGYANAGSLQNTQPAIDLYLTYSSSGGTLDYGAEILPSTGIYTVGTNSSNANVQQIVDYGSLTALSGNNTYYNCYLGDNGLYYNGTQYDNSLNSKLWATSISAGGSKFSSGSLTFEEGRHGYPYVYSTNLKISTTTYNITIGDSRALTATYTSCRVATDIENGKAVLQAYDGINTMTLVFNVDNIDANIGIPAGTYTIGTDVNGGCTDDDGYTRWMFSSGTVKITQPTSGKLSMSTTSLVGVSSGSNFNCSLTISSKTPNKTFTAIDCPIGILGSEQQNINGSYYYPQYISGYNNNNYTISWKFPYTQWANIENTNVFSAYNPQYGHSDAPSSNYIEIPSGSRLSMPQGVAVIDYNDEFRVAEVTTAYLINNTFYYVHLTTNQLSTTYSVYQFGGEDTGTYGNITFDDITLNADLKESDANVILSSSNGTNGVDLFFNVDVSLDGVLPTGSYRITATQKENTILLGTIADFGSGASLYGASAGNENSLWLMRDGYVNVINVNEQYYITTDHIVSGHQQSMSFTMGIAPKTLTFNSDENGSVAASFNATNWGKTITDYAEGTAYPFFTDQTILLTPTPASSDYVFDSWTASGATVVDNNNGTYSVTIGASNVSLIANFRVAATPEITLNEDGSQHLDNGVATSADLSSKYAGRDVNVKLNRQLYGGSWNTIVFPFSVEDLDVKGNELYDILRNSLYELQPSTTTATADGMIINFLPLSYEEGVIPLKAGVPYLIRTSADIDLADYKFENVRLNPATNPVLKKEGVDLDVQFIPVMTRTLLTSKKDIVVVGSRLYYPNQSGGSYLRAFRAYLHITNGAESNYVQPRIRIVDTGEIIALDEEQEVETRKYIEDGILIIERGGVRYDAQGKRME